MIEELVTTAAQSVPEAPLMTVREQLRRAQRELADEGNIWTEKQALAVESGDPAFSTLAATTIDAEVVRVLSIKEQDRPVPFTQVAPDRVEFPREPKDAIQAKLVIRPSAGKDLPSALMAFWREGLIDGALGWLFFMPQPWQNNEKAQLHQAKFRDTKARGRQMANLGYQQGGARVRPRRFI